MLRLNGKRALVTGGTSGIGLAAAEALACEGARVVVCGRDPRRLERARAALNGEPLAIQCDVTRHDDLERMFTQIAEHLGGLDVLFVNAGVVQLVPFEATTEDIFDRIVSANFKSVFFTVQRAVPLLCRGASVILNGSIAPLVGSPAAAAYAATKAAVRTLARNLTAALRPRQVRVNVVSPGPIEPYPATVDPQSPEGFPLGFPAGLSVPIFRLGKAAEVAAAVAFLASSESRFMCGAELVVDGGRTETPDDAPLYRIYSSLNPALRAAIWDEAARLEDAPSTS